MPRTLAVGVTAICVSALTSAVTAALIFTFGRQLLASELADIVNQRTGETLTPASLLDAVDGPDAVMRHRAVIWWVIAAVYLLLALPVRFGHFGAKAVLSVCVPVFGGLLVWDLHDKVPTVFRVLDGGAILTAVTAVVLIWLEPSNNYRRLRKEAARARRAGVAA